MLEMTDHFQQLLWPVDALGRISDQPARLRKTDLGTRSAVELIARVSIAGRYSLGACSRPASTRTVERLCPGGGRLPWALVWSALLGGTSATEDCCEHHFVGGRYGGL